MAELLGKEETTLFDYDDQRRLNLTQSVRERVVTEMLKDGKLPEDEENRAFLFKALDGLDRQTLGKASIRSKDKANDASKNVSDIITQLLLKTTVPNTANSARVEIPALPASFVVTPVPGEMDGAGGEEVTYDSFVKKFE